VSKTKTQLPTPEQTSNLFREMAKKSHEAIKRDPESLEKSRARMAKAREGASAKAGGEESGGGPIRNELSRTSRAARINKARSSGGRPPRR
jgi:hypothetical protein